MEDFGGQCQGEFGRAGLSKCGGIRLGGKLEL